MTRGGAPAAVDLAALRRRATNIRRHVLRMAERVGQGYVGQGLGIADLMAVLYFSEMRFDPARLDWPERDRFVLSTGHYSIGLYAALAEAGVFSKEVLDTYGADGSILELAGSEKTPGFEMTGGSLAQGLSQAVGMALGARLSGTGARIYCLLSDGEMQEGSTWEAAMSAGHYKLDNLCCFIDSNQQQADGPPEAVMGVEPIAPKWVAFGWRTIRIDGNDVDQIVRALDEARKVSGKPQAIVIDTLLGKGVPMFEDREKNHFIRVEQHEWDAALRELNSSEVER